MSKVLLGEQEFLSCKSCANVIHEYDTRKIPNVSIDEAYKRYQEFKEIDCNIYRCRLKPIPKKDGMFYKVAKNGCCDHWEIAK